MKYRINEAQEHLFKKLNAQRKLHEQEFLAQQTPVNLGEEQVDGKNWYTVEVTILSSVDTVPDADLDNMDNRTYFNALLEDAKDKIKEAFHTAEFEIHNISTKSRGSMQPY